MKHITEHAHLKLLATLIAAATLAACSSTTPKLESQANNAVPDTTVEIAAIASSPAPASMEPEEPTMSATVTTEPEPMTNQAVDTGVENGVMTVQTASDAVDAPRPGRLTFNFGFNQAQLNAENQAIVEAHGRFLAEHPEIKLVINGHSDSQGDSRYNEQLSLKRAQAVADLLMSQGAMKDQIEIFSWGANAPLADAQHNRDQRRVELKYVDDYIVQSTPE